MKTLELNQMENLEGGYSDEKNMCIGLTAIVGGLFGGPGGYLVGALFGAVMCEG